MNKVEDKITFYRRPGAKYATYPELNFIDLQAHFRKDSISIEALNFTTPPTTKNITFLRTSDTNYYSIYAQSWLPMGLCAGDSVVLDRNIISDIHNRSGPFRAIIKHLNQVSEIDIHCATLEGCILDSRGQPIGLLKEEHRLNSIIKAHIPKANILSNATLYSLAQPLGLDELDSLTAFCMNVQPVYIKDPQKRLEEVKNSVKKATSFGIIENSSFLSLVLNAYYQPEPRLSMYKAKELRRASNPEKVIRNMLRDVHYATYMLHAWTKDKRPTRFLTADIALALYLIAHQKVDLGIMYHNTSYLFPEYSSAEYSFFRSIGLISDSSI